MSTTPKKSISIAVLLSLTIAVVSTLLLLAIVWWWLDSETFETLPIRFVFFFFTSIFGIGYVLIYYWVKQYTYRRVKKIYDDFSSLEASPIQESMITTDMETLTRKVQKYASDKRLEIETLKGQEAFRKEFLGNVAHEIKTPLFTVQGYILTLLGGALDDKAVRKKYLQRASKGVDRLLYVVKDLDMITKLETGGNKLELEKFDLVDLIQSVFDFMELRASKLKITLEFDMDYKNPIYVFADRDKIQQVLSNLIENSLKYGKKGGTTEVSIQDLVESKLLVRVTDNGEGVPSDQIPRLFERFYRVDKSGSREEGGSGLGLSIVKHIIEAHQEKIFVESDFGIGSEFSFTLEKSND